jgi:phosphoribosyl-ATP pyrophosphohydrolase/phosphoribosyl-AMP cyclohydrolase/histidinol dehydrogenase
VACAKAGVSISDVEAHLDRRALKVRRRPGDSKPARIAAAKAHFDAMQAAASSAPTAGGAGGAGPAGGQ